MLAELDALLTATYVLDRRFPAPEAGTGPAAEDHRRRAHHPGDRPDPAWGCRTTASSSPSPPTASATCSPTCQSSPATTSACERSPRRSRGAINYLAFTSPGWCDELRLLDSTPVPCAASRETARRSEFAGLRRLRLLPKPLALAGASSKAIESVFWTCKGQLGLERHGARTLPGLCARVSLRLLALAAGLWRNAEIGQPGRSLAAYAA